MDWSIGSTVPDLQRILILHFTVPLVFSLIAGMTQAADLRVMKTGLGKGAVSGPGISCGITAHDPVTDTDTTAVNCNTTSTASVTLTVAAVTGSSFSGWGGDCGSTPPSSTTCTLVMDRFRSVRANFTLDTPIPPLTDLTPDGIRDFLDPTGPGSMVNTQAEFVASLPEEFRENWMLMPRSESLQTGTAQYPRILLTNNSATQAFTLGLVEHSSFPGSHPWAIEWMQWDAAENNFRFHEIIVRPVPGMDETSPGSGVFRFSPRPSRGVTADDTKCFACHSTNNVINNGTTPGTTGNPIGRVKFKSKPNWDTYDSWAGMLAFTRDRIYQGSVEAAAFRRLMNLWTWQTSDEIRSVIEQLDLQPSSATIAPSDVITRWDTPTTEGGETDGHIQFAFDTPSTAVDSEPLPSGPSISVDYLFQRDPFSGTGSDVVRNTDFVTLQHSGGPGTTRFGGDEGRGTNFFNNLYLTLNPSRIVDEITPPPGTSTIFATGSVPIDVRPILLAIAEQCIDMTPDFNPASTQMVDGITPPAFFNDRNGMDFDDVFDDTLRRNESISRRKADIQKHTLDRTADVYIDTAVGADPAPGLIDQYGSDTDGIVVPGPDLRIRQTRQEVFRRATPPGTYDRTVMGGIFVEREQYQPNVGYIALFRYFLEPLGVSVDKWSLGVRGRSRTYSFADNFEVTDSYIDIFQRQLRASLGLPAADCSTLLTMVNTEFGRLPAASDTPTYTDIQRIFNRGCIECHGGLNYPPVRNFFVNFDLSEDESPPVGSRRLTRSLATARTMIGGPSCPSSMPTCTSAAALDVNNSYLYNRVTDYGTLVHPYDPTDIPGSNEDCPSGIMPCGGPPLNLTDIKTIERWIIGGSPNSEGDPHIETVDGVNYDFQSAGEFTLLRDPAMELQSRQSAVTTSGPLRANPHTGLSSCVSVNTAVAMRVGDHRVTYQPKTESAPDDDPDAIASRLQLRVDGKPVTIGSDPFELVRGGRIIRTNDSGGVEVQFPGGTRVAVSPRFSNRNQIHLMQINVYNTRATEGVMGKIAPENWLPQLSTGEFLGPIPESLAERHVDLYETFADSWRVDESTSLFDYEADQTPDSFVVSGWPVDEELDCLAPEQPGIPETSPTPGDIDEPGAEDTCSVIDDPNRRDNCIYDLIATGDKVFVDAYLDSQALDQRLLVAPPSLAGPPHNSSISPELVNFSWQPTPGADQVDVIYYHCLWEISASFDFNKCTKLSPAGSPLDNILPPAIQDQMSPATCLTLFTLLLIVAIVLYRNDRRRAALIVLILAILVAIACWLEMQSSDEQPTTVTVENLKKDEIYRWKVVAETADGLVSESQTHRFET